MSDPAAKLLDDFLLRLQRNARVRKFLAVMLAIASLCAVVYFIYDIVPRTYSLSITGGDILSNRHYLAKVLQEEALNKGVSLEIRPTPGSLEALALVDEGKLDLAFIQGGLESRQQNVVHVATVAPELLHLLVRPDIKEFGELRGKLINFGAKQGGTRVIARQVLEFSGLIEGIDYVESNIGAEDLLTMRADRLPDAIVLTSFAPSDIADFMVRQRGYRLLEIPFPGSLALRLGWVADSKILAYTYSVSPPVPAQDIRTVGVNLHLVANRKVDPRAVYQVLESLFDPGLESRLKMKLNESELAVPSGFALSEGSRHFIGRKNPVFSAETLDRIKALFGLILSIVSTVLLIFKWFKGEPAGEPGAERKQDAK